jgi:hypothetical protein
MQRGDDFGLAIGCLSLIRECLEANGIDMSSTPPMMYPDAINTAIRKKTDEIERMREIIRKIPMKCPHCLSKLKIDAIERQDWIAADEYRTLINALAGGEE